MYRRNDRKCISIAWMTGATSVLGESRRPCTECEDIYAIRKSIAILMLIKYNIGTREVKSGETYWTGVTRARLDIQESKSVPCEPLDEGGLAGGEPTDSGGEGYGPFMSPSRGETGTEGGWTLM